MPVSSSTSTAKRTSILSKINQHSDDKQLQQISSPSQQSCPSSSFTKTRNGSIARNLSWLSHWRTPCYVFTRAHGSTRSGTPTASPSSMNRAAKQPSASNSAAPSHARRSLPPPLAQPTAHPVPTSRLQSQPAATPTCTPSASVLLELYLNRSIEPDVQSQVATYGSADYRGVAIDLLEDHSDDMAMTAEYNRATRFCLSPHPNPFSGSFSFEDQGFREIFYNEVIVNLEDNLRARF